MYLKKIYNLSENEIATEWEDRHYGRHSYQMLRELCPCAICKAEQAHFSSEKQNKSKVSIYKIKDIEQVGMYAVKIIWADGHDTGIYSFEYLRSICECSNCQMVRENLKF